MSNGPGRDILALVAQRPLLTEGAVGTMLANKGVPAQNTAERCITHPDIVAEVHREYRDAGADIFWANSFVGNRHMLESAGLGDSVAEIQAAAIRIVREAVGPDHPCGINIGPTGALLEPLGPLTRDACVAIYREQLDNQLPGAPDFLIFETFEALEEIECAFEAATELAPDLPKVGCVSFSQPNGRTMMGVDGETAARRLEELGADIIGTNCGHLDGLMIGLKDTIEATDLPVLAEPNAGIPQLIAGETVFSGTPEEHAQLTRELLELGVRIVGGCCGTTPEHIAAAAKVVREYASR